MLNPFKLPQLMQARRDFYTAIERKHQRDCLNRAVLVSMGANPNIVEAITDADYPAIVWEQVTLADLIGHGNQ